MKIVPHQKTSWGNIYNAIFSLYKISFDDNNFKYILLSESCIPVKSFSLTYKFLTNNQDSFLCYQPHRPKTEWEKATLIQSLERYVNNAKKSKDFLYKVAISDWFYNETWNILNKKGYKIITIGYPGLYSSLKGGSGNAVVEFKGMTFERSKADLKII